MRLSGLPSVIRALLAALLLLAVPAQARAAVEITFYSHEFGSSFPHAFITLKGTDERTGKQIDENYGFTATHISPAILLGSVQGEVWSRDPVKEGKYIADSNRHFSFTLNSAEHEAVRATIAKWSALKQPSYDLNRRNCVHFVADMAASLGMRADTPKALMKKPRPYIDSLTAANRDWLLGRGGTIHRAP